MIGRWIFAREDGLSRGVTIILAALAFVALAAMLPLRVALGVIDGGGALTAREVAGAVWSGAAADLQAGPLPLGDVHAALRPLPLFIGRAEIALERVSAPGHAPLRAVVRGGKGWAVVKQANGELALGGMMAPLPVRAVTFADFGVDMRDGHCVSAGGTLGLAIPSLGPMLPRETLLSGHARCKGNKLVVPMRGPSGMERLDLSVEPDGKWRADLSLTGLPDEVSAPLLDMGFVSRPYGIGLIATGSF